MTGAQRLKRVLNLDVETGSRCGVAWNVIACVEDQDVIDKVNWEGETAERSRGWPRPCKASGEGAPGYIACFRRKRIRNVNRGLQAL